MPEIIARGKLTSVFQPIVDLSTHEVVGYEALSRGPSGTPLEQPERMFSEARRAGLLGQLDVLCRERAFAGALDGGMRAPLALFVNAEPDALSLPALRRSQALVNHDGERPSIIFELTERALTARPAELLSTVGFLRGLGYGIALDDVGADSRSLALMPFLRPDVIKLDLSLVQRRPSDEIAGIVTAVTAEAERSGATILAEGIETDEQLATALGLGAHLGQGWLFGRPRPLPSPLPVTRGRVEIRSTPARDDRDVTPFELVAAHRPLRRSSKRLLLKISRQLEEQALAMGEATVVLSTFQAARHLTPLTGRRYERLARTAAFVGALGAGLPSEVVDGVRYAPIEHTERLVDEWDLVVLAPHFAAALVAHDLGDEGSEPDRRFDYALTYDRDFVVRVATTLMSRVAPLEEAARVV